MMTTLMDKRKRSREDDYCESTPLSKRINNLHINNNNLDETFNHYNHHHQHDYSTSNLGTQNIQQHINNNMNYLHHNLNLDPHGARDEFQQYLYDPELSEHENPFYYSKNKLLHELHFERVKRNQI